MVKMGLIKGEKTVFSTGRLGVGLMDTSTIGGYVAKFFGALAWSLLVAIASPIIEERYRIMLKVKKIRYRNADAGIKPHIKFTGDFDFEDCKDKAKEVARGEYSGLNIHNESSRTLEMTLGEQYRMVMTENGGTLTVYTDRIDSDVKSIKKDFNEFLDYINSFEQGVNDLDHSLSVEGYELELFLPYVEDYVNINMPEGWEANDYELEIKHRDYRSKMKLTQESVSLNAQSVSQLNKLVESAI